MNRAAFYSDPHAEACRAWSPVAQDHPPTGHYKFWVENNEHRVDGETPYSVRLTKDGSSEDKHFEDLEEYDEATAFEIDV